MIERDTATRRCARCRLTKPVARFSADRPELCKTCAALEETR